MSAVTSPRESPSIRSPSIPSSRTSLDLPPPSSRPQNQQRRNRAALRDYYGLKAPPDGAAAQDGSSHQQPAGDPASSSQRPSSPVSELDSEGFDAPAHVKHILATQGLEGVLRIEGDLINEIKSLDGSRKALVYDNYSKLIAATDTIRRMRTNMDPLTPATTTLAPAVSHIAETAAALSGALLVGGGGGGREAGAEAEQRAGRERATVRWVLDAPRRLGRMAAAGQKEAAAAEWEELEGLLGGWEGVAGVEELRRRCEAALLGEEGVR